jgi:hypothetical protein
MNAVHPLFVMIDKIRYNSLSHLYLPSYNFILGFVA